MDYKPGQILNCAYNDKLFMKLISWRNKFYYKTPWTHSAIIGKVGVMPDGKTPGCLVYEALDNGFVANWYEQWWLNSQIGLGKIEIGEAIKPLKNVNEIASSPDYLGKPYGTLGIFFLALSFFGHRTIKWSDGTKSLICSEAVARVVEEASNYKIDFSKEFGIPEDEITPDDLAFSNQIRWSNG